jgi:replicative DNA helicase
MQAEQAVLGGVLISPDRFQDIADKLHTSDFTRHDHREIWAAFIERDKSGHPIDLVSMCQTGISGEYIGDLYRNTPSAANIEHYAGMVKDSALERSLLAAGSRVMEIAKGAGDIREKLDKAQSTLMAIAEGRQESGPKAASEYIPSWMQSLEDRVNRKGELIGVSTGLSDLDKITAGLQKTDLIIVAGRPSMGKTTLAMNFAETVSVKNNGTALAFSMEMSASQLIDRSACSMGSVDQGRLRLAELSDGEWAKVTAMAGSIKNSGLYIDETPGLTIIELRARAKRVHRKTPLDLIVVDYIQLMSGHGDNQNLIVSEITRGLKGLAKELRVPVVALSQLNRSLEQRSDKRPRMADLRDSGAIEQDADVVIFVYRDEVYDKDSPRKGTAEIIISKQRNGETGMVPAVFQGHYCRFVNFIGEYKAPDPTKKEWKGGFDDY